MKTNQEIMAEVIKNIKESARILGMTPLTNKEMRHIKS